MSTTNDSLLYDLALSGFALQDDMSANNTTQATATAILGEIARVITSAGANGSMVLKSSLTNDAPPLVFVLNDSPNTIRVFSFTGENLNGSLNGTLAIPSGQGGIFIKVPPQIVKGGGGGGTTDWRAAAIP